MIITNNFNLPDPVVRALSHDNYTKGESNRSVTQLIDSPRVRILRQEHASKITYDASELIWIALGKAVHRMFEDHGVGKWLPEKRLFADALGWVISGQVDLQETGQFVKEVPIVNLYDYKVTSVYSLIHWKSSYDQQQNFYGWLVEKNGMLCGELFIVFIFRDWKKRDYMNDPKNYPESPIMVVPANSWSPEKRDQYVAERVKLHQQAEFDRLTGTEIAHCTDEDRWKRNSKHVVIKPGAKKAYRAFDTLKEAEEFQATVTAKGYVVEERKASPIRCADGWCPVADWCSQWQAEKEQVNERGTTESAG